MKLLQNALKQEGGEVAENEGEPVKESCVQFVLWPHVFTKLFIS